MVLCMKLLCKSVRGCEIFFLPLVRGNDTATSEYCSRLSDVRLIEHNRDNQFPLDAVKLGVDWWVNQYLPHLRFHCCWSHYWIELAGPAVTLPS